MSLIPIQEEIFSKINSPNDYKIHEQKKSKEIQFKCLIANDEPFQLMMMSSIMKKMKFDVFQAENGYEAYHNVRKFTEDYSEVKLQLQQPGASCKHLSQQDIQLLRQTLKNFDIIILDLNMPIMNGYKACERICEIYTNFNSLRDFDEILIGDSEEQQYLNELEKVFDQINSSNSDDKDDFKWIADRLISNSISPSSNQSNTAKQLKDFYEFKREFNGMLKAKPLIVACTAEVNPQVIKNAKAVGFDKVIQSPLTEAIVEEELLNEIEVKLNLIKSLDLSYPKVVQEYLIQSARNYKIELNDENFDSERNLIDNEQPYI